MAATVTCASADVCVTLRGLHVCRVSSLSSSSSSSSSLHSWCTKQLPACMLLPFDNQARLAVRLRSVLGHVRLYKRYCARGPHSATALRAASLLHLVSHWTRHRFDRAPPAKRHNLRPGEYRATKTLAIGRHTQARRMPQDPDPRPCVLAR
jgi:hypothetical protein